MNLINDLAYIMIVAGVVTILFKRLKQPLILGYIVAGFLAGPHMPYMPTISDKESLETWSQIGVIFMMFSLGLEFSFKKVLKMGASPVITALCIVMGMISLGSGVGWLFGWNSMTRLFLGGMMAMSSTTIIYKAFDDMGLTKKKFAKSVMSVLILEDMLGILLMVVLSAMAVSKRFEGTELAMSLMELGSFLCLWFLVGIFIIPLFLKRNKKYINRETLLIVSVGLCFLLVILANKAGYSSAFGAFVMGSILAETVEAERIDSVIGSVKDLFGAIFFVSVGMLVDPTVLDDYFLPIVIITVAILFGQCTIGVMSYILGGQNLKGGIQSGFSMAQIGEFAFILASLGNSLHVTDAFLYPVVVAVSIITTFLTPYMIKAAEPAYRFAKRITPQQVQHIINNSAKDNENILVDVPMASTGESLGNYIIDKRARMEEMGVFKVWLSLLKQLFGQVVAYYVLTVASITLSFASILPLCRSVFGHWPGNVICGILTLLLVSLFLRPIVMRKNRSEEYRYLESQSFLCRLLLKVTFLLRFALTTAVVYYIINFLSPYRWWWHVLAALVVMVLIMKNRRIKYFSIRMERTFKSNLNRRDRLERSGDTAYARRLNGRDIHIVSLTLPDHTAWAGISLRELQQDVDFGVDIVAIVRGSLRFNIPGPNDILYPRDTIEVVGDDTNIEAFTQRMQTEVNIIDTEQHQLHINRLIIDSNSPYREKQVRHTHIRHELKSIIIGIEMDDGTLSRVTPQRVLHEGDILWLVG